MLSGQNIVCFAKDWNEDPTSNNHVMRLLAQDNRVLWLNSIATRTPSLNSSRDWQKIAAKLQRFARGATQVDKNLWVFTPMVVPLPYASAAQHVNVQVMRATLSALRKKLDMDNFQLWTFIPTAAPYAGKMGESLIVYYCTDEWSQFSETDASKIVAMEADLCQRADLVFTTSQSLRQAKARYNPHTVLASHGVDYDHFRQALDKSGDEPLDIRQIPRPRLGFFGLLHDWIDIDLIADIARRRPNWSIVLIGKATTDISAFEQLKNVHVVGRRPYADLPAYCRAFDAGLIPFRINELTRNVNPIKLREYLSAGLPVVSTALPEVVSLASESLCVIANTADEFVQACETLLQEDSPQRRSDRSLAMEGETWSCKVSQLGDEVERAMKASHGYAAD